MPGLISQNTYHITFVQLVRAEVVRGTFTNCNSLPVQINEACRCVSTIRIARDKPPFVTWSTGYGYKIRTPRPH